MLKRIKLVGHILGSNFMESMFPYKLTFSATSQCNSHCCTCGIWRSAPFNELSVEEIDLFFARNPFFSWIDVTGGEFFLRDDADKIINIILNRSKNLYHLHIPSNAVDPECTISGVQAVLQEDPELFTLTISLDGPPDTHDRIRGVPGNWMRLV